MLAPIEEIDHQADHHPDDRPLPGLRGQVEHEAQAGEDAEHGSPGH